MHADSSVFSQVGLSLICAGLTVVVCNGQTESPKTEYATQPAAKPVAAVPAAKPRAVIDPAKVMIQIDDKKITEGELARQADEQYGQVAAKVPREQSETYRNQMRVRAAQSFISTTLLENEAAKRKITVTDADLEKAIADITKRVPPGKTLEQALQTQNMTLVTFRERLKKDLRIKKVFDEEVDKTGPISDKDVADFYEKQKASFEVPEQVTARHILVKVDEKDDAAAKAVKKTKIDDLKKKIDGGADFATLARENSDCPSAKDGGMLGKFGRGQMVPAFDEAAFSQATNVVGPVIETQFGYHIVQVLDKSPAQTRTLDEVKSQIVDYLKMMKGRQAAPLVIDRLRASAKVTIDPELDKEIQAQKMAQEVQQPPTASRARTSKRPPAGGKPVAEEAQPKSVEVQPAAK